MLAQAKANELIAKLKEASRTEIFTWLHSERQEELLLAVEDAGLQFLLNLKRSPYEIRLQFRTKDRHIPLARVDNAAQHPNPDGTIIRGPHIHWFREGEGMAWAEPIDWYRLDQPMETLFSFLDLIHARFPRGIQEALL